MNVFYIPDGHRRFSTRENIPLKKSYEIGYRVLIDEVIHPLITDIKANSVGIFLLSSLNITRRNKEDLHELLNAIDKFVPLLKNETSNFCSIRIFGHRYPNESRIVESNLPTLYLFIESEADDFSPLGQVDLFIRSGGAMRLSGAPRELIGPYTEMMTIDKLHPDLSRDDILTTAYRYNARYMLEAAPPRQS